MKKLLLILLPVLTLVGVSGGVWWEYGREPNPLVHAQTLIDKGDLQAAVVELGRIVRLNPKNASARFRLGEVELKLGAPVAAEEDLKQARDGGIDIRNVNPLLAEAYMARGKYAELLREFSPQGLPPEQASSLLILRSAAQLATGDKAAAQASAAEAERLMPQSVEAQVASAQFALARHDLSGAETNVRRALLIDPRSGEALLLKGQLQKLRGDPVGAISTFDEAIVAAPNLVAARLERANDLLASNEDVKARQDVEAVLKVAPTNARALYLKSVILVKAKDYAAADVELAKLGSLIFRFPRGAYFLALVKYNLGQGEQATNAASQYLANYPNETDAIKLAAAIEMASRRYETAIRILTKATDLAAADVTILELLEQAYSLNGQPAQAVQPLERATMLAPDNIDILMRLAAVRMSVGDAAGATDALERSLKITPARTNAAKALVFAALASANIDKAILAVAQVKKQEGDSEAVGNLTGMIKMAQIDPNDAAAVLSDTLKRFPQSIDTRVNLARVLILQSKLKDAEQLLNEVMEHEPANVPALNALIPIVQSEGHIQRSVVEAAHRADPQNPAVTMALANLLIPAGDVSKALELINANLKERSTNIQLLAMRARLSLMLGQSDAARDSYRQILDQEPGNLEVRRSLLGLLLSANDTDSAKSLITEGLRALPGNADLLRAYLEITLRAQGLDETLATADRLAADPGNQLTSQTLKGDVYTLAGRFADAISAYAAEQRSQPSSTLALRIAAARSAAGQPDQAARGLREWLATEPGDADAAGALVSLDLAAHRFYDAEAHLQIVLNKRPNDAAALNSLAWVYQQRKDARARSTAEKAYLISPAPRIADTLGWILTADGDAAKGLVLLRQAVRQLGNLPTIRYHLAVALKDTGQSQDAFALLQPIVQGSANFEEKPDAARLLNELAKEPKAAPEGAKPVTNAKSH